MSYAALGQYDRTIEDMDEAIRVNPQDARSYVKRAGFYEAIGKTKESERDFQKAEELGYKP
jgi:Tfp pilus assembly protein PilF